MALISITIVLRFVCIYPIVNLWLKGVLDCGDNWASICKKFCLKWECVGVGMKIEIRTGIRIGIGIGLL